MGEVLLPEIVEEQISSLTLITNALGIDRGIIASDDEISDAWRSLPSVIKKIPPSKISKGVARMCIAVSAGLFDSAINYIWNDSIVELRNKVKNFGLNIVGQVTSRKDFDEQKLNDLKDSELLDLCLQLNLINEEGYFFLNQCREIRNNFSAAHPTIGDLDNHEFINYVNRCAKYALGNEQNPIGVNVADLITALKLDKFSKEQLATWIERIESTHEAQRELIFNMLHGIYCDPDSSEEARVNALKIVKYFKEKFTPTILSNLIDRHQDYVAKGKEVQHRTSQIFFEKLELLELLSDSERHSLISHACKNLWDAHLGMNNFYNEPPFAERLLELSSQGSIPKTAKIEFVQTVIACSIGNQYGTSHMADDFYKKMIKNFSPQEVQIMFDLLKKDGVIKNRISNYPRCKKKFKQLVCLIDKSTVPTKVKENYGKLIEKCAD